MTAHCIETLRESSVIKTCFISMFVIVYNIPEEQNDRNDQEILYYSLLC